MLQSTITESTLNFLNLLKQNNNREWFTDNKTIFKQHEKEVKGFLESLKEELSIHDDIEKLKMFRIYRDVRFSKDKTPYKTHLAGSLARLGAHLRGGYYIHIEPGNSFIATGFWAPNKEDLLRIRKEFENDASEMREIMSNSDFKKVWGELKGDTVKTAPKGFDKNHENIDLIKYKQYIFVRNFKDKEVTSPKFLEEVNHSFQVIRPFFDYMSDVLTTNLNGESLLD